MQTLSDILHRKKKGAAFTSKKKNNENCRENYRLDHNNQWVRPCTREPKSPYSTICQKVGVMEGSSDGGSSSEDVIEPLACSKYACKSIQIAMQVRKHQQKPGLCLTYGHRNVNSQRNRQTTKRAREGQLWWQYHCFNENPVTLEQMDQNPANVKGKTPFCIVRGRIINFRQNDLHQFWIMFAISNGMEGGYSGTHLLKAMSSAWIYLAATFLSRWVSKVDELLALPDEWEWPLGHCEFLKKRGQIETKIDPRHMWTAVCYCISSLLTVLSRGSPFVFRFLNSHLGNATASSQSLVR